MRAGFTLFCAVVLIQLPASAVRGAPLDKTSCEFLKTEQAQLEQAGVRASLMKGAQWGKANLDAEKLAQVKRLIEVDQQVLFRCDGRPLIALPKELEADPAAIAASAKPEGEDTGPGAAVAAPKAAPPAEKKAPAKKAAAAKDGAEPVAKAPAKAKEPVPAAKKIQPASDPAAKPKAAPKQDAGKQAAPAKAAVAPTGAEPAAKPKPKPKPKMDDAYKPPAADGSNPFATQFAPAAKN